MTENAPLHPSNDIRHRKGRRRFLYAVAGLGLTGMGLGAYTSLIEPHWIELVERDMPVRKLPAGWVGKKIVQISDLHVAINVDSNYLISVMRQVSALKPEMTVFTGDFMTSLKDEQIGNVAKVLKHLEPGPKGCVAIFGNHDYGLGWSHARVAEQLSETLGEMKIRVLRNEVREVDGLQVVGLDDLWGPNFKPERVLRSADWSEAALTLCHNPDGVDLPKLQQVRGWILSGHTHGGQCKPPFLPPPILPVKNRRYTSGAFDVGHGRMLYINRGIGHLRRVRFNARPEITVFRLVEQV